MTNEIKAALEYREWVPDVFGRLWNLLEPSAIVSRGLRWSANYAESMAADLRDAVGPDLPATVVKYLGEGTATDEQDRVLNVLLAIDIAFDSIHPWTPATGRVGRGLETISSHYWRYRRYDRAKSDARVLPTSRFRRDTNHTTDLSTVGRSNPSRTDSFFRNLFVYQPAVGIAQTLTFGGTRWSRVRSPVSQLRIGICPLAEDVEDASIVPVLNSQPPQFKVSINKRQERVLADRAREALQAFDRQKVDIAVFPELMVTSGVRMAISRTLKERALTTADGPPSIRLVIAGSGYSDAPDLSTGKPFNESHVFDVAGRTLFVQRKMNHYSMPVNAATGSFDLSILDEEERSKAHALVAALGRDDYLIESMSAGTELHVHDTPFGRVIVLICEDLYQSHPSVYACDFVRPDWIFVPVMDSGLTLRTSRWMTRIGTYLAEQMATNVIIANSLLLERISPHPPKAPSVTMGFGLVVDRGNFHTPKLIRVRRTAKPPVHSSVIWPLYKKTAK